ncbi:putative Integrase family protein [uncultured Sporomusa sp.]|uniref:Putative Integrase family protein n=1 Tax=uncultured Sporomusa sp. TaxID=307249 RepID=A0A212LY13_9FIRM|nr:site-specific integrase [uncultured Sporomusa sp.]SCM82370.1 putative Integrase family protein [uncultured Sporomusa sp.]
MASKSTIPDKKRANNAGSIYYDKQTDSYRAALTLPDGKRASKRFKTEPEAENWLALSRAELGLGTFIAPSTVTVGEYMADWLETHVQSNVRPRTFERYLSLIAHIETIQDTAVQKITATKLKKLYNGITVSIKRTDKKTGEKTTITRPASGETKKKVHNLLSAMLEQARIDRIIMQNPAKDVAAPKVTREEIETFSEDEIKAILDRAQDCPIRNQYTQKVHPWFPALYLAIVTGIRMSELLGLRWEDIDLKQEYIHIRQTLQRAKIGILFQEPKTKAGKRKISLPPEIIPILTQLREKTIAGDPEKFSTKTLAFVNSEGHSIDPNNWQRWWRKLLKDANVVHKNFHALRHTHATKLLAAGVPLMEVSRRLGHSKPSHTLDLYGHAIPGHDQEVAKQIGDIYNLNGKRDQKKEEQSVEK